MARRERPRHTTIPPPGRCHYPRLRGVRAVDLPKRFKQSILIRLLPQLMNIDVPNNAIFVDDEQRPLRHPFFPQDAVAFSHIAVGIEVAQQRIGHAADLFSPRSISKVISFCGMYSKEPVANCADPMPLME